MLSIFSSHVPFASHHDKPKNVDVGKEQLDESCDSENVEYFDAKTNERGSMDYK